MLLLLFVLTVACSERKSYDSEEYMAWAKGKENGIKEEKKIGDYTFKLLYKPCEYIALKETESCGHQADSVKKIMDELKGMQYYTFYISSEKANELMSTGNEGDADYSARLQYFSGDMQNDLYIIQGKDTLPCILFHYERNFGLAPSNVFSLGFDLPKNTKPDGERTFLYDDKILGTGKVQLTIAEKDIINTPILKLN